MTRNWAKVIIFPAPGASLLQKRHSEVKKSSRVAITGYSLCDQLQHEDIETAGYQHDQSHNEDSERFFHDSTIYDMEAFLMMHETVS